MVISLLLGLRGGGRLGRNVLNHVSPSSNDIVVFTSDNDYRDTRWVFASGGNGTGSVSFDTGNPSLGVTNYFSIRNNTYGNKDFNQRPVNYQKGTYQASVYARLPKDYTGNGGTIFLRGYSIDGLGQLWYQSFNLNSKDWVKFTYTFKTDSFYTNKTASFAFGVANKVNADFASPSLIQLDDITLGKTT